MLDKHQCVNVQAILVSVKTTQGMVLENILKLRLYGIESI